MMPHPENHVEDIMGCTDGRGLFAGLVAIWRRRRSSLHRERKVTMADTFSRPIAEIAVLLDEGKLKARAR